MQTCARHVMWMCCVVLRMRGEAGGARGKAGVRSSGSNYPPISAAYWLPPSNPTPYHVPGSVSTPSFNSHTRVLLCCRSVRTSAFMLRWIILDIKCSYQWLCNRITIFCTSASSAFFSHSKRKASLTLTDMPTEKQYVSADARYYNSVEIKWHLLFF